jgi:hypothetical protein
MQMLNQVARYSIVLLLTVASSAAGVANEPRFATKEARRDANGVTFRTAAETMRIEVCGEGIIHVVVGARYSAGKRYTVLFSSGRTLGTASGDRPHWIAYAGLQFHF